ncbi:MAG TPA: hypothetical protein VLN46_00585 [Gillisia sp.]|nr:hypothetical protein [Gillisia sp.]
MNKLKVITMMIFLFSGLMKISAQTIEENPVYYINVLIDSDHNIYVQEKKTEFDEVTKEVRSIAYNIPVSKYQGIIYRIYGDKNLKMGNIIDVGTELIRGFDPIKLERYLLNLEDNGIDGSNYLNKLEKLDLKPIDP